MRKAKIAKKKDSETLTWSHIAALLIAVAAIVGAVALSLTPAPVDEPSAPRPKATPATPNEREAHIAKLHAAKQPPPIQPGWLTLQSDQVKVIHELSAEDDQPLQRMQALGVPAVIEDSRLIKNWPIMQWDLLELSRTNLSLPGCRLQKQPVFVLGHDRDKGGMLGSRHDHPVAYINTTLDEFLKTSLRSDLWFYWTGGLDTWEQQLGKNATNGQGWEAFRIVEANLFNQSEDHSELFRPMLWLSHSGVVTQTHYDTQHNYFLQLQGRKRFLLFPPSAELYSYPNIHRSYRQSQVHLEAPRPMGQKGMLFPSAPTEAYELIVQTGDILYIPPYWSHRVESLTMSLSMSVLSPSEAEAALAEVFWQPVPFGAFADSRAMRISAVRYFFDKLFALILPVYADGLSAFMADLHAHRFAPLALPLSIPITAEALCPGDESAASKLVENEEHFVKAAQQVAELLLAVQAERAVKLTFLRDYLEQIVRWAVGPQLVAFYLANCQ